MSQAIRAGKAFVEFSLRDGALRKGLKAWEGRFKSFGTRLSMIGGAVFGAGAAMAAAFVAPVKAASDLEETMNKFNVVFGNQSTEVKAWGDQYAATIGRSEKQVAEFMSNTQDLFIPLGFKPGAATDMSKQVTQLAFDLASFNNKADGDAMNDLQAALTGSGEVMKKYGVVLSEAAVQQELLNQRIDPKKATNQQKVMARMNIILAGTTAAQGDAVRSAGAFANQLKGLEGVAFDTAAAIGGAILPYVTTFVSLLRSGVTWLREFVSENTALVQAVALVAIGLLAGGAAIMLLGGAFMAVGFMAGTLATVLGAVGSVLSFLVSPIGLVVAAAAGVVYWFTTMTETGQEMVVSLMSYFGELAAIVQQSFGAISAALSAGDIAAAGEVLWATLKLLWLQGTDGIRTAWHNAVGGMVKIWFNVWAGIQQIWNVASSNLTRGWSYTTEFFGTAWDTWVGAFKKSWNATVAFFEKTWLRLKGLFGGDVDSEIARINDELEAGRYR